MAYELVFLSVKAYALEAAMNDCAAAVGSGTMIFLVLNSMRHQADRAVEWARRLRCLVIRTSHPSRAY